MSGEELLLTIVTSAAVGAIASSLVGLLNGALERKARRRELLLDSAMKLAFARRETEMKLREARRQVGGSPLKDDALVAEEYYWALTELLETGSLPASIRKRGKA